jgi:hypothetical protein
MRGRPGRRQLSPETGVDEAAGASYSQRVKRRAILLALLLALALPAVAGAADRGWTVRWPLSGRQVNLRLTLPASAYPVDVQLDGYELWTGQWTRLGCPMFALRATQAFYRAYYYPAGTVVVLSLYSGRLSWTCGDLPRAGATSVLNITTYDP